jgi:DNA mismatch repair ATPase MutL
MCIRIYIRIMQEEKVGALRRSIVKNDFLEMKIIGQFNLGFIIAQVSRVCVRECTTVCYL